MRVVSYIRHLSIANATLALSYSQRYTSVNEFFGWGYMSEKFGQKLREARTSRSLTLEGLAEVIGSSKAYIWQLENKKNAKPSAELLLKIANYFGESPDYFLDDSSCEPTEGQLEDAFFRKFQSLSLSDKLTIQRIASKFENDDENTPD